MKAIKYMALSLLLGSVFTGCNDFLDEEPLDFYSPDNSMITQEHFQTSLNYLYYQARNIMCTIDPDTRYTFLYATDFAHNSTDYYKPAKLNDYANTMVPTFGPVATMWNEHYKIITNANVILNRIEMTDQVDEASKDVIRGEALFFRGYAYRALAHLYGGVPLVLEEINVPRRDFVRATREEVYKQIKQDLETAITLLPNIESVVDGKVNRQVAQHLLSEIDICLGLYDEAVKTASEVINYPEVKLMTNRFGSRQSEEGDVYWDLFRLNNQNRSSGNKEGLWVMQYDYLNPGSPNGGASKAWAIVPQYDNIQIKEKDSSGKEVSVNAFAGITDGKGGGGIGWIQPTKYFFNDI